MDIFVDSEANVEDFAGEIESLLGVKLERFSDNHDTWYEFRNPRIVLTVGEHEFENDRDMNFEDYRYDISVRPLNIKTPEERKKWSDEFSHFVYEKLKATRRYRLMMVEDAQVKLDEFDPGIDATNAGTSYEPILTANTRRARRQTPRSA